MRREVRGKWCQEYVGKMEDDDREQDGRTLARGVLGPRAGEAMDRAL